MRSRHTFLLLAAAVIALAIPGCDQIIFCFDSGGRDWAIEVVVTDSLTGLPLADGALGVVRDGPFTDTLSVVGFGYRSSDSSYVPTTLGGLNGRFGTYDITITHAGYLPWSRKAVRVAATGRCFAGIKLTAALLPVP